MQQQPNPQDVQAFLAAYLALIIGAVVVVFAIRCTILAFFCLTLQKALNQVSERNRLMQPVMVWLLLIPCFDFIWHFFIVIWVPGSLEKEFRDRGQRTDDCGKTIGLTYASMFAAGFVIGIVPFIGMCAPLLSLVGVVCWIIFWVKIAGYSGQLAAGKGMSSKLDRGYDDDDDR